MLGLDSEANVVILVVDSTGKNRMKEADKELKSVLADEELKDWPILVIANKQDLNGSIHPNEVTDELGIEMLKEGHG